MNTLSISPLIQLKFTGPRFSAKPTPISARFGGNDSGTNQQLNLSVLRFTFGIPGFDESYLPRWIGFGFGSLLVLNQFFGSGSGSTTEAQLRSEALGMCLAGFSVAIPYFGKFLKGNAPLERASLPEGTEQIFVTSPDISDAVKEDLAWATYILLRNTNTIAVMISVRGELCVRGYWNTPDDVAKAQLYDWFEAQIQNMGVSDLKETLYFPQSAGSASWGMLPKGIRSLLVQPVIQAPGPNRNDMQTIEGFVLVASTIEYAYSDKDIAWIEAIANKFRAHAKASLEPYLIYCQRPGTKKILTFLIVQLLDGTSLSILLCNGRNQVPLGRTKRV